MYGRKWYIFVSCLFKVREKIEGEFYKVAVNCENIYCVCVVYGKYFESEIQKRYSRAGVYSI